MIKCHYCLLAEFVREGKENKLDLLGVFDRVWTQGIPTQHPQLSFVALLTAQGEDDLGKQNAILRFIKPNGETLFEHQITFEVKLHPATPWFASARLVFNFQGLVLPVLGKYQFVLEVAGKIVASHPLTVAKMASG